MLPDLLPMQPGLGEDALALCEWQRRGNGPDKTASGDRTKTAGNSQVELAGPARAVA